MENWLRGLLSKDAEFEYHMINIHNVAVGIIIIRCAINQPISFKNVQYIRVGSYTKKLSDYPSLQSKLWRRLNGSNFEGLPVAMDLDLPTALHMLDYEVYFDKSGTRKPESDEGVAHYLIEDGILQLQDNGLYSISNMGAILFAKRLAEFPKLSRKALRIIQYKGNSRMDMLKEKTEERGYAVRFEEAIEYIEALTPTQEVIVGALREKHTSYPLIAIREAVANALIHQDFTVSGTGTTVEIFNDRIEITNPGIPLVNINRIVDNPPKSRNEKLASLMRRLRMCEEVGTGWDKIVMACESQLLPTPRINLYEESTKVTLFSEVPFASMSYEDRVWSCYMHACVLYVRNSFMTNSSLRDRFGVPQSSAGSISRLIKKAIEEGHIRPVDPKASNKYMRYVPFWA